MKPILHAIFFSSGLLLSNEAFSQNVGIGTSAPDASAKLEIVDANRGFLFPRVSLTATNVAAPVTTPANWLVVFNTTTAGAGATAVSPGLYYWDNTLLRWVRIQNDSDAWRTLGNAGTNPATNFIGTTDAQDFVFRTSNVERMRVSSAGNVGIATSTPAAQLIVSNNLAAGINRGIWSALHNTSNAGGGLFGMRRSRGTEAAPLAVASGDYAGALIAHNYDGASYLINSYTGYRITGAASAGNIPGQWYVSASNANDNDPYASGNVRMVVNSTGEVGIGTTTPADRLDVNGGGWLRSTTNPFYVMSNPSIAANGGLIHTQIGTNSAGTWGFKQYTLATGLAQNQTAFNLGLVNMGTPNTMFLDKLLVVQGTGQVAMGAAITDLNAQLDVVSTSRGVLLPRVALTQTTSFAPLASSPSTSLLVYNTATINDVSPGFYYWNGTNWVRFQTSNTNNWTLLGNAGTNPATNFIGTTDAQDFVTRTNNTERMRITSNGWVGIGTNNPSQLLEVNGGRMRVTAANPFVELNGTWAATPNLVTIGVRSAGELVTRTNTNNNTIPDWETKAGTGTNAFPNDCYYIGRRANPTVTNASYFFHIDATGNVGVNTTAQNALLHVNHPNQSGYSALTDPHIVQISSTTTNSNLVFALNGAGSNSSVIQSKASATTAWGLSLNPYGGNVGVGVINPQAKFHTVGTSRFEQNAGTMQLVGAVGGHSYIEYYSQGIAAGRQGYIGYPSNGNTSLQVFNETATGDLNFGVGGTATVVDMTLKNNGFVGIGISTPNQKLTVEAGNIEIGNNNDNVLVSRNNAQGLNHQMIGTYMGWDTRGVYLAGYNQNNLGGAGTYNATNRIYAGGSFGSLPISATAFTVVSAQRYKQNILPVAYGLSSILNLRPVQYQYTFEQEKPTHVGFIAEEVEKVIPEIVVKQTNPETPNYGQAMGVNYTELVPVLVKGMQEQQTEIETLKKQNARLEAELQEIKKMLLEKK